MGLEPLGLGRGVGPCRGEQLMDEELRRQVEALKAKLHADGVSDYQRYEAMQILSICPRCGDREGHICLCLNDE